MIKEDKLDKYQWRDWFAWHPISISEWVGISDNETQSQGKTHTHTITTLRYVWRNKCVWLERVERRAEASFCFFGFRLYNWEYKLKK